MLQVGLVEHCFLVREPWHQPGTSVLKIPVGENAGGWSLRFSFVRQVERRQEMFGRMNVIPVLDFRNAPAEVANFSEGAVARLLDITDYPKIEKWVQFPKALFVFLVVPGDPESGAFYMYDRHSRIWYWVDFDDEKFGGYSVSDFDHLVRECRFLDIVERPHLLAGKDRWIVDLGSRPQRSGEVATAAMREPA